MYGTVNESLEFFDCRLHADSWENSPASDREKALKQASHMLDRLSWTGERNTSYVVRQAQIAASGCVTDEQAILDAGLTQQHAFPRGSDTVIPQALKEATFLIGYELLINGADVNADFNTLNIEAEGHSSVRVNYQRDRMLPHIVAGIPSFEAWQLIHPYLQAAGEIELTRVS